MTSKIKDNSYPKIVSDAPVDDDRFKSHIRIARATLELISSQIGGKTIGIQGEWGSGKSTIIKILNKLKDEKYTSKKDFLIFNFDAWVHQGEPLRRVFLESIINEITNTSWLTLDEHDKNKHKSTNYWIDLKDKISGKYKESKKSITTSYSNLAKFLLPSMMLFPLGIALIASASRAIEKWELNLKPGNLFLIAGIFFASSPFIISFAFWISAKINETETETENIWHTIFRKTEKDEVTKIFSDNEATSIEFQNYFGELLRTALRHEQRRIIIVLDNLDRINESDLSDIWSMLRSFIDNPLFEKEEWFKQLWVIIPYSIENISNIKYNNLETDNGALQEHFLEKSFQIKFYVPPLPPSSWREHLNYLLNTAFSKEVAIPDSQKIYVICAKELGYEINPPSPRQLTTFVNNIVGLKLQWPDVAIAHHALFLCLRNKNSTKDLLKKLTARELPTNEQKVTFGNNIENTIISLLFNIEESAAIQILLKFRIQQVLLDETGESLRTEYKRVGFHEAFSLNSTIQINEILKNDNNKFISILSSIINSKIIDSMNEEGKNNIFDNIKHILNRIDYWPFKDPASIDYLNSLADLDSNYEIKELLVKSINKTSNWFINNKVNVDIVSNYEIIQIICDADHFTSRVKENNYFKNENIEDFKLILSLGEWVKLQIELKKINNGSGKDILKWFSPLFSNVELIYSMGKILSKNPPMEIARILQNGNPKIQKEISNSIKGYGQWIVTNSEVLTQLFLNTITLLLLLYKTNSTAENIINEYSNDIKIFNDIDRLILEEGFNETLAIISLILVKTDILKTPELRTSRHLETFEKINSLLESDKEFHDQYKTAEETYKNIF